MCVPRKAVLKVHLLLLLLQPQLSMLGHTKMQE
jgi:hypothetical protein